jgi:hypothetical protein
MPAAAGITDAAVANAAIPAPSAQPKPNIRDAGMFAPLFARRCGRRGHAVKRLGLAAIPWRISEG